MSPLSYRSSIIKHESLRPLRSFIHRAGSLLLYLFLVSPPSFSPVLHFFFESLICFWSERKTESKAAIFSPYALFTCESCSSYFMNLGSSISDPIPLMIKIQQQKKPAHSNDDRAGATGSSPSLPLPPYLNQTQLVVIRMTHSER